MIKRISAVLCLVLLSVLSVISCGKSNEIKVGGTGPLTGEAATYGQSTLEGYELAVEEFNSKGGVLGKKIKLVFADDKGDPTEAATVFTKLIDQDKVVAIAGAPMSKCTLAGGPIAQANKIPVVSSGSTNIKVTDIGDYIFRVCYTDPFQGTIGAKFAIENLKAKNAGCIFDLGNDYAKGLSETFRENFTKLGGKITAFEGHPSGTTDFKAQLTKIIASKPDVIYVSDFYNDVALIAKQARELGYKGPLLGGDGWDSPKLTEIGGAALNNGFYTNHYAPEDKNPIVQEFVKKYNAKYKKIPDALGVLAYDAMYVLLDSIQKAGSTDGEKIRDAIAATNVSVVTGKITFDKNRNPVKSAVIMAIENGKTVYKTTVNP